jgi:predicted phosphoadenosine phosphosulfate sulfurtransferase
MDIARVYYTENTVHDAALERIRYLFDEFEEVLVAFSGGKDSTVTFNLALMVAKEKNRLPLRVMFIDQEGEWQCAIDYIREIMLMPEVKPMWYQFPIRIFNATSMTDNWLYCWAEDQKDKWIREKESFSIKEAICPPETAFNDVFSKIINHTFPKSQKVAVLGGMRAEENPKRRAGLTSGLTYKHITWGKALDTTTKSQECCHFTFYPLYDWSFRDIWKAIHDYGWKYCKLYDYQYQDGVAVQAMRVSNLHHETALHSLTYLHKVERDTWNKLVIRLGGINTFKNVSTSYAAPKTLPFMFETWQEYRDYLVANLTDEQHRPTFYKRFERDNNFLKKFEAVLDEETIKAFYIMQVSCVLLNDYYFTNMDNFLVSLSQKLTPKAVAQAAKITKQ